MDNNDLLRTASKVTADTQWFNGSSDSIFNRLDRLQELLETTRMAASNPNVSQAELDEFTNIITATDAEREALEKVASEWVDFDTEDYLQSLPGGTVASVYRVSSAGTSDLGEDDGSLLYRTARSIEDEFEDADWINFVTAGAEVWVEDQTSQLLNDQINTREAAVFYVEQKTLPILDVEKRAAIIDNFVDNAEICRRAKKEGSTLRSIEAGRINKLASTFVENSVNESFGEDLNWL